MSTSKAVEKAEKRVRDLQTERDQRTGEIQQLESDVIAQGRLIHAAQVKTERSGGDSRELDKAEDDLVKLQRRLAVKRLALAECANDITAAEQALHLAKVDAKRAEIADLHKQAEKSADRLERATVEYDAALVEVNQCWQTGRQLMLELAALEGDQVAAGYVQAGTPFSAPLGPFREPVRALEYFRAARKGLPPVIFLPDWLPNTLRAAFFERVEQIEIVPGRQYASMQGGGAASD